MYNDEFNSYHFTNRDDLPRLLIFYLNREPIIFHSCRILPELRLSWS